MYKPKYYIYKLENTNYIYIEGGETKFQLTPAFCKQTHPRVTQAPTT